MVATVARGGSEHRASRPSASTFSKEKLVQSAFEAMLRRPEAKGALAILDRFAGPPEASCWSEQFLSGVGAVENEFDEQDYRNAKARDSDETRVASRTRELDRLHKTCLHYSLDFDCLYLARALYDRIDLRPNDALVGSKALSAVCLFVATKAIVDEEFLPFDASDVAKRLCPEVPTNQFLALEASCLSHLSHRLGVTAFRERHALAVLYASALPFLENLPDANEVGRRLAVDHPPFGKNLRGEALAPNRVASTAAFWIGKLLSELALFEPELNPPKVSPVAVAFACVGWSLECVDVPRKRWSASCLEVRYFAATVNPRQLAKSAQLVERVHLEFLRAPEKRPSVQTKFSSSAFGQAAYFVPRKMSRRVQLPTGAPTTPCSS